MRIWFVATVMTGMMAIVALPITANAQNSNSYELEVDEDELLELELLKHDEPLKVLETGEEATAAEDAAAGDAAEARAEAVSEELIDASGLQEYRLGPGDQLSVVVFGQEDLSGELAVDGQGRISLPLIGQVQAQSKTVNALQQIVTDLFTFMGRSTSRVATPPMSAA